DIRDLDQDAAAGRQTLVAQLGVRTSVRLAMVSAIIGAGGFSFLFLGMGLTSQLWISGASSSAALAWLAFTLLRGRRLLAEYDKSTARSFYRGHLVAYSLLNTLIILAAG